MSTDTKPIASNVTPQRQIRVATPIWAKACRKAKRNGQSISEVVRAFLADYVRDEPDA